MKVSALLGSMRLIIAVCRTERTVGEVAVEAQILLPLNYPLNVQVVDLKGSLGRTVSVSVSSAFTISSAGVAVGGSYFFSMSFLEKRKLLNCKRRCGKCAGADKRAHIRSKSRYLPTKGWGCNFVRKKQLFFPVTPCWLVLTGGETVFHCVDCGGTKEATGASGELRRLLQYRIGRTMLISNAKRAEDQ